jgi:hypothetical protein
MAIQDLVGDRADGLNYQGADGDVGHKASIHHIDVHPVATSLVNGLDLRDWPAQWLLRGEGESPERHPTLRTSSPKRLKSADRIEGETMMSFFEKASTRLFAHTRTDALREAAWGRPRVCARSFMVMEAMSAAGLP